MSERRLTLTELLIAKQPDLIEIAETWLDFLVPDPAVFYVFQQAEKAARWTPSSHQ